jgi:MFS family permease
MQLAAAALFVVEAFYSVIVTVVFVNHDNMLKVIKAQGTQIPAGSSVDTVINIAIAGTIGVVVFFGVCQLVGALGSYLGWRWMFWVALVLFGLGGLGALTNIPTLVRPETSPIPLPGELVSELLSILSLATFVWMLIGVIRFGPWAMKKPGT